MPCTCRYCFTMADIQDDLVSALEHKNPKVKVETLKLIEGFVGSASKPNAAKVHSSVLPAAAKSASEAAPDIREAALAVLASRLAACQSSTRSQTSWMTAGRRSLRIWCSKPSQGARQAGPLRLLWHPRADHLLARQVPADPPVLGYVTAKAFGYNLLHALAAAQLEAVVHW